MADKPIINDKDKRKISILDNTPAIFQIADNLHATAKAPFYEWEARSEVGKWCGLIIQVAENYKVDRHLVMAIMYMETSHGWYDKIYPLRETILPMNIHYKYWQDLGVTKEKLGCPFYNIEFGAIILSRIRDRLEKPTIEKIASIYNFLGAEKVTDYGARVASVYRNKPWIRKGCAR